MLLGIADICMLQHIRAGMTRGEFIRRAADFGVQTASLRLEDGAEAQQISAIAAAAGIELEFRTGATEVEHLTDFIKRTHGLGASFLRTMVSGKYHYKDPVKQALMLDAAASNLKEVVPLLDELDMTLAIENHADVTSPELITLIDEVGSDRVRALLDFGNSIIVFEDPRYTIETLAPYAVAVHAKDLVIAWRDGVDFCLLPVALGEGIIDFEHVMEQLMAHCSGARFLIEGVFPPLPDREENLKAELQMLERSVAFAKGLLEQYTAE